MFLAVLGLCCCVGLSLVVAGEGYPLAVCGLLTEAAPRAVGRAPGHTGSVAAALGSVVVAPVLWSAHSMVVTHWFSCPAACGIFSDCGSDPWPVDPLPLSPLRSPVISFKHM